MTLLFISFFFVPVCDYVREARVLHELYATEDTWASCTRGTCVKMYWYWSITFVLLVSPCGQGGEGRGVLPCRSYIIAVLMKHESAGTILYFVYLFI